MLAYKRYLFPVLLISFFCLSISFVQAEGSPEKTVAINPLTIHSSQSLDYLQAGIRSMIASRLAADAGVKTIVIAPDQPKPANPDYTIDGSLTSLGSGVSLDVEVRDRENQGNPRHFYATAETENDIIGAVNNLATQINHEIFSVPAAPEKPAPQSTAATAPVQSGDTGNQNAHPERAFITGEHHSGISLRGRGFKQLQKTQTLNYGVQSFAIGDIDGDQQEDFILGQPSGIKCYHMVEGRLQQFSYYPLDSAIKVLHISMADLDGDKKDEIYLAAKSRGNPVSLGLVWQGDHPVEIFRDDKWYIRALQDPTNGWLLAGQKAGDTKPLENGIFELKIENNRLEEGSRLNIPVGVTLYSFAFGDVNGDGIVEIVMLDKNDYLQVVRSNGSALWASSSIFGGSPTYIGKEREAGEDSDRHNALEPDKWTKVKVPPRIIATDLNGDGIKDIVICRNNPRFSKIMANVRSYDSAALFGLAWNGVSLEPLWQTGNIDGFITDLAFRPEPGDSQKAKLYAGLILPTSAIDIVSKQTSTLLTFDVDTSPEKPDNPDR